MTHSEQDLFRDAEAYLRGEIPFDRLYGRAVALLPGLHAAGPDAPATRLAALVAAMEAEGAAGEFTEDENRDRLREFLSAHAAHRRR